MSEFKTIIKKLRSEKHLSQSDLANELNISSSTVAMWETGSRFPGKFLYEQLADFFNVDIDYLYGRSDVRQKVHSSNLFSPLDTLSIDEKFVVESYRSSDEQYKKAILRMLGYYDNFTSSSLYEQHTSEAKSHR